MSKISFKLDWSEPQLVNTSGGGRMLSTAPATPDFWRAWKEDKPALKDKGISCGKDKKGDWRVCWWKPISAEEERANIEASRETSATLTIPSPEGLEYLPFQKAAIKYANERDNTLLGLEMGCGKTVVSIGLINLDASIKNVLVVCPASLKLNWYREMKKWLVRGNSNSVVIIPDGKTWVRASPSVNVQVTIINYDLCQKHSANIRSRSWDLIITDECHYLKGANTIRKKSLLGGGNGKGKKKTPAVPSRKFLALSGTPIPNKPIEIFNIANRIAPHVFPSYWDFGKRYGGGKAGWGGRLDFGGSSNLDELQRNLRGKGGMYRVLKKDVLKELPDKTTQIIEMPPSSDMKRELDEENRKWTLHSDTISKIRARKAMAEINEDEGEFRDAARSLKEGISVMFAEMSKVRAKIAKLKIPYVGHHLRDVLESEDQIVVMCHHHSLMDGLMTEMIQNGISAVMLNGRMSMADRQKSVDLFQGGHVRVFIGSIQAAGVGITLTAASTLIFAEQDWTPGNMDQAGDRIHRIGQENAVLIQHVVMEDSLDSKMMNRTVDKKEAIDAALDVDCPLPMSEDQIESPPEDLEVDVKEKKKTPYRAMGEVMTSDQKDAARFCLKELVRFDSDKATVANGMGFSKLDSDVGHELAVMPDWTDGQAGFAKHLAHKYRKQLPTKWTSILTK